MNISAKVIDFNKGERVYTLEYKIKNSAEEFSGQANIRLATYDSSIQLTDNQTLLEDIDLHKLIRNEFMCAIFSYNNQRLSKAKQVITKKTG
jgi:hypothetical protein